MSKKKYHLNEKTFLSISNNKKVNPKMLSIICLVGLVVEGVFFQTLAYKDTPLTTKTT